MKLTRLFLIVLGMLLVIRLATAATVRSQFPGFSPICDGAEMGPGIWDCFPLERRRLSDRDEVLMLYIPAVASFDLASPVAYPEPVVTPIYRAPDAVTPETSAVPEPGYGILIAIVGLIGMLWQIRRKV